MTHQHDEQPLAAEAFTRPASLDLDAAAAHAPRLVTIADILALAKLPESRAEICLEPNLLAKYESTLAELTPLIDAQGNVLPADEDASLDEESPAARAEALAAELDTIKGQMQAAMWRPLFRGLSSEDLMVFQKEHYPKEQGAPLAAYHDQLIATTMVEPKVTLAEVQQLRRKLAAQSFAKLIETAQQVCTTNVDVPKLPSFSRALKQQ